MVDCPLRLDLVSRRRELTISKRPEPFAAITFVGVRGRGLRIGPAKERLFSLWALQRVGWAAAIMQGGLRGVRSRAKRCGSFVGPAISRASAMLINKTAFRR